MGRLRLHRREVKFEISRIILAPVLNVNIINIIKGVAAKMKLNVIFLFRTINYIKLQGVHFYIIDNNVSGKQGVNRYSSAPAFYAEIPIFLAPLIYFYSCSGTVAVKVNFKP